MDVTGAIIGAMSYDEVLAQRIHDLLDGEDGVTSRAMFGGLGFMVHGHLAVAAADKGALMVRVDPSSAGEHLAEDGVELMQMGDRTMHGLLLVDRSVLASDQSLERWVQLGVTHARALPPVED